mgnify:CR=1 FL=1
MVFCDTQAIFPSPTLPQLSCPLGAAHEAALGVGARAGELGGFKLLAVLELLLGRRRRHHRRLHLGLGLDGLGRALVHGELDGLGRRPAAQVVHARLEPLLPRVKVHARHLQRSKKKKH